jgi:hypothetical protein
MRFMAVQARKDIITIVEPWLRLIPHLGMPLKSLFTVYGSHPILWLCLRPVDGVKPVYAYRVAIQTKGGIIRVHASISGRCSTRFVVTALVVRGLVGTPVGVHPLVSTISPLIRGVACVLARPPYGGVSRILRIEPISLVQVRVVAEGAWIGLYGKSPLWMVSDSPSEKSGKIVG